MKKYYTKLLNLVSDYSEWIQQQEQKKKNLDELFKGMRIAGETRNKEKKLLMIALWLRGRSLWKM